MRNNTLFLFWCSCFFSASSCFSQACTTYSCDSLMVRSILDSNGSFAVDVRLITDSANGRITSANLNNIKRITGEIGFLTGLRTLSVFRNLNYISPEITRLTALSTFSLFYTRICTVPDTLKSWLAGRNFSNFAPDCTPPTITLKGKDTVYLLSGTSWVDSGATASQQSDGDLTAKIVASGNVDTSRVGTYTVTYSVVDEIGNSATKTRTVCVIAADTVPPRIYVTGDAATIYQCHSYKDSGAQAIDLIDGDITERILVVSNVDTSVSGTYHVQYSVADRAGNTAQTQRTVTVLQNATPPAITVIGANPLSMYQGLPYSDPGATALDPEDGNVTNRMTMDTAGLNVKIPGNYSVVFTVTDMCGQQAQAVRTIHVLPDTVPPAVYLLGNNPLPWTKGKKYADPGARAIDPEGGDVSKLIRQLDSINVSTSGTYQIHFKAFDYAGNFTEFARTVTIISDTVPPRLELYGDTVIHIALNGSFREPGYKAFDDEYNIDLTRNVIVAGTIDSSQIKEFELRYSVADSAGNVASLRRHIFVDSIPVSNRIMFNQVGYLPAAPKIITSDKVAGVTDFRLYGIPGNTLVKTGTLSPAGQLMRADISDITAAGRYQLSIDGLGISNPITIGFDVYDSLFKATLKAYYYQRASNELKSAHAGVWNRPAGHPDTSLLFYGFAGRTGTLRSPGGWYDAGDYGKYIVNAGITLGTFFNLYELYPDLIKDGFTGIPESNNQLSDLLDESRYELDWFATMQDADGGVFFKIGPLTWPAFIMPHQDLSQRYVIGKSTASSLNFAAAMAMASRIWKNIDRPYADSCLSRSIRAWTWAKSNPAVPQPAETGGTGDYTDGTFTDEFFWAGSELYIATGDTAYKQGFYAYEWATKFGHWQRVFNPGIFSLLVHLKNSQRDSTLIKTVLQNITGKADEILSSASSNQFDIPYELSWGSNGDIANKAILLAYVYRETGNAKYLDPIYKIIDYFLGHNSFGYSFVTGFGYRSPQHPHHRISGSDGITAPVPGFMVGGPNSGYIDAQDQYTVNEVAINWNAPLVFILSFLKKKNDQPVMNMPPHSGRSASYVKREGIGIQKKRNILQISFSSHSKTTAMIYLYNLAGRRVSQPISVKIPPGESSYHYYPKTNFRAQGTYVLKVKMKNHETTVPTVNY